MNETLPLHELQDLVRTLREGLQSAPMNDRATETETEHAAVMWVLTSAFITFCEENGLVGPTALTRGNASTDAHGTDSLRVIEQAMAEVVEVHPALTEVFHGHSETWRARRPDEAAARRLVTYWRNRTRTLSRPGSTHWRAGTELDTRHFGDLYQHLSESSRKGYALLTTPDFVIDLVLDRSLGRALEDVGSVTEQGLRYIDPACGSGGFLLGAFQRVLSKIHEERPALPGDEAVALALRCVHGADLSPIAVMVSRFRLAIEAIRCSGGASVEAQRRWRVLVVEADSLLEGSGAPVALRQRPPSKGGVPPYTAGHEKVLGRSTYDAVATNPPYIVSKDKDAMEAYREGYPSARSGPFALTVPFTECAFALARPGGRVGLLMANSFAKREFGKPLVEDFLPQVDVDGVIDTSGAYIPGHGTPTLVLTGRDRAPSQASTVTMVSGKRGEPFAPEVPSQGKVWTSIKDRLNKVPSEDGWTASQERPQQEFWSHPWRLGSAETDAVFRSLRSKTLLKDHVHRIGYIASTGADDLFSMTSASMRRWGVEATATIDLVTGSQVRDWQVRSELRAFFPRTWQDRRELVDLRRLPGHRRRLWPYQSVLAGRSRISPQKWYDWHQLTTNRDVSSWSIVFPWVATHTHFALNRIPNAPLNSAPVIELPSSITEDTALGLLGVLNSSTACFWLKQVSQNKGNPRGDQIRSGDGWEAIYEFTASRMVDLPIPALNEIELPRELATLAQRLLDLRTEVESSVTPPAAERIAELGEEWDATLQRMILLQEELDWRIYESYGLVPTGTLPHVPLDSLPDGIVQGQRAFEFSLAREGFDDPEEFEEEEWFTRNAIDRFTELPDHWSADYRLALQRRIDVLREHPSLRVLESPTFKHRWVTPSWESVWRPAIASWLLEQCERREFWYTRGMDGVDRPIVRTVSELTGLLEKDPIVVAAVEAYSPGSTMRNLLPELLREEHVPFLSALRFRAAGSRKHREWTRMWERQWSRENAQDETLEPPEPWVEKSPPKFTAADFLRKSYWANRGKFDMPNERFTSYSINASPGLTATSVLGWAGWDARERAWALVDLIEQNLAPPQATTETLIPLLAGLAEVLPWVDRVGAGIGPRHSPGDAHELKERFGGYLDRLELTQELLSSWAPPAPRRGRPPKHAGS